MASSASDVARQVAATGQGLRSQLQRLISRLLRRHELAERVFLGPDGQLTKAALDWFEHLARENYVDGGAFDRDERRHAFNEGRRQLALEIIQSVRLDMRRLEALTKAEREASHD